MATAPPASPNIEWTWPAKSKRPPLELQLLPPSPLAGAQESPWGVDPSRLQQLMMGTSAAASSAAAGPHTPSSTPDLGALFDDRGSLQPLPSGWERCLDLQSGEVFLKQSCDGATRALQRSCQEQGKDEKPGSSRGPEPLPPLNVEQRQDWSFKWLQGDHNIQHGAAFVTASLRHGIDNDAPTSLDGEPLCLDLNLRLTNGKRGKSSINSQGVPLSRTSNCFAANMSSSHGDLGQSWKWQQGRSSGEMKPSNLQEMVTESTMVTAVCSKCLMYVLLRKSKPVCPRCSVPIILDSASTCSVSRKRPLLEFSSRDLSLSTDS